LQSMPPNLVLIGLAVFLTLFVMNPIFMAMNNEA
jgi:flagellar biosynthesis protein FliP